ncbi:hypothetical protein GCM10009431_16340 [Gaetbulibacter jejuensis]|uniref:Uncharacterized protein n=1 Tax=Gaetbulibacter jejuensis TaxID=584607 RepID=A0ABN1JNC3_9FLAO
MAALYKIAQENSKTLAFVILRLFFIKEDLPIPLRPNKPKIPLFVSWEIPLMHCNRFYKLDLGYYF